MMDKEKNSKKGISSGTSEALSKPVAKKPVAKKAAKKKKPVDLRPEPGHPRGMVRR